MSSHRQPDGQMNQNQNNQRSDDPRDGSQNSYTLGRDGAPTAVEKDPNAQDQETIEAFGRDGAGKQDGADG